MSRFHIMRKIRCLQEKTTIQSFSSCGWPFWEITRLGGLFRKYILDFCDDCFNFSIDAPCISFSCFAMHFRIIHHLAMEKACMGIMTCVYNKHNAFQTTSILQVACDAFIPEYWVVSYFPNTSSLWHACLWIMRNLWHASHSITYGYLDGWSIWGVDISVIMSFFFGNSKIQVCKDPLLVNQN